MGSVQLVVRGVLATAIVAGAFGAVQARAQTGYDDLQGYPGAPQAAAIDPYADMPEASAPVEPYVAAPVADAAGASELAVPLGESGGAPSEPVVEAVAMLDDGYRSEIERTWFAAGSGLGARAVAVRMRALELGIENLDSAARALIVADDPGNELSNAMLAVRMAPDLPIAHMALARAHWNEGNTSDAIREAVAGVSAIASNLEASAWLVGTFFAVFALVLTLGSLFFIASVGIGMLGRAAHDLGDLFSKDMPGFARIALPGCILLIPLLLGEGIAGLTLALFGLGMVYGSQRHRMALALAVALVVMGLYPMTQLASTVLRALDSDRLALSALAVLQGTENTADVERLEAAAAGNDFIAEHVLAVRARRSGHTAEAIERYEALHADRPREPVIMTNYANLRFNNHESEAAVELYERSSALLDSSRLMFNLSQAYARLFRIEEFETALQSAQSLDAAMVADLSRIGDSNFVADVPFPMTSLSSRLLSTASQDDSPKALIRILIPGMLGRGWMYLVGAFAAVAVLAILLATRFDRASSCLRCGKRICARCDSTTWSSEVCDGCHHLFHRPETTDPVMRMTRLSELQVRESRRGKVATAASLLIPGVGGLLARRPDLGFLGIFLFGMATTLFVWRHGIVPDPLTVGSAGSLAFVVTSAAAGIAYLGVVVRGLLIRRSF